MQTPTADIIRTEQPEAPKAGKVVSGIREAANTTGVSFDYLLAQATQESGLDPHAHNTKSTAAGLFQFTAPTWIDMVKRHGAGLVVSEMIASQAVIRDNRQSLKWPPGRPRNTRWRCNWPAASPPRGRRRRGSAGTSARR